MTRPPIQTYKSTSAWTLLCALWALHGCTALILNDADTAPSPCDGPADCASGMRCDDGVCIDDEREASPPPAPGRVDAEGGVVPGPDGVILDVPAGALDRTLNILIERASATTPIDDGLVARSRFYRITPDATLDAAATLAIPLATPCAGCAVHRLGPAGFVPLPTVQAPAGTLACTTASFGLFVIAEEAP